MRTYTFRMRLRGATTLLVVCANTEVEAVGMLRSLVPSTGAEVRLTGAFAGPALVAAVEVDPAALSALGFTQFRVVNPWADAYDAA